MIRRILHATDFSSASRQAFRQAVALAIKNRAQLLLLHVADPFGPMVNGSISPPSYQGLRKAARAHGSKRLAHLVAKASDAGVRATAVLREGTPWAEIVRVARARTADVIVIGTHGRTGLSRLLIGSVASRVVGLAKCPVLTVRGRRKGTV